MGLFARIKTAFSPASYFAASSHLLEGWGMKGAKPRPFNAWSALEVFHGFAGAAAWKNATAKAGVPLRLYTRRRPGAKKLYATRPVPHHVRSLFDGYGVCQPSKKVMTKAAEFAGDMEEVAEPHPILEVMRSVNPFFNGYELDILKGIDLQVVGNHYQHVVTDPLLEIPGEVWRFDPRYTRVIPSKDAFLSGYLYGHNDGVAKAFPEDEIDHFKLPNPKDYHYGMGWVERAWSAVGLDKAKRIMELAKFDNMARPDWLLSIPGGTEQQFKRLSEAVEAKHKGPRNAGKFMVAAGDVKATALQWDVPEVGSPTRIIEEIAAVSGVPVAMLLENDPTKSSSQTARLGWYRDTVQAYCKLDEEKLNERWVPRFGKEAAEEMFLAYDPVAFEDREAQQKRLVAYVAGGIMTPNEARQEEGYEPSDQEEADRLYPPTGSTAGAAAVAGNASVNQNDRRRNED